MAYKGSTGKIFRDYTKVALGKIHDNDCKINQLVYEGLCADMKAGTFKEPSKCPKCGQYLVKRKGKYGEFLGCSGYPGCKYTEEIKKNDKESNL